jgi:hypothetical protein
MDTSTNKGEVHCFDLRPWAKAHRYKWRWEEAAKEDDPFFIEVVCRKGLIYPKGGDVLLAYAYPGVKEQIAKLVGIEHHQTDDRSRVFRFPVERLDEVAKILRPKKLRGSATLTPEQRENLKQYAFKAGKTAPK